MSFSVWPGYLPGDRWTCDALPASSAHPPSSQFVRPLGALEAKFDQASQVHGQSDTFVRLRVALAPAHGDASEATSSFLGRLTLGWAAARAKHPLLGATISDASGRGDVPGVRAREFRYAPPASDGEALERARATLLVHEAAGGLAEATEEVQQRYVLNGERVLLDQASCLARLLLVRSEKSPLELGFFLVISHVISDGLSVFKLVNEVFTLASSPSLPTPPSPPAWRTLASFLSGSLSPPSPWPVPPAVLAAWQITFSGDALLAHLPLPNEEHYPVIPLPYSQSQPEATSATELPPPTSPPPPSPSSHLTTPRKRWYWAIHRVLLNLSNQTYPRTLFLPRIAYPNPPVQSRNRWPQFRLDRDLSSRLIAFSKRNGLSPSSITQGMLLYSLISLNISNIFASEHPTAPYHPVILGFPFSFRPFLSREPPISPSTPCSDPASDLSIRITFGQLHLPNLPLNPNDPSMESHIRAAALRGARFAKEQFVQRLAPEPERRSLFMAEAYSLVLQRLLNGTGCNPIPFEEPKTAFNASSSLRLSDLNIGVRLHRGEGLLLEALTWDGMITFCLGVDDGLIAPELVERLLGGVKELAEVVARSEDGV
ncbi:hypothetical protein JCM10213v2_004578 [Rhodosporidiobolus nylandii]